MYCQLHIPVERSVLEDAQDATPGVGVPERAHQPEGQGEVDQDDPHQVEGVHHGQAAQVNHGRLRHAAVTETDHVEGEEVGCVRQSGEYGEGEKKYTVYLQ